MGEDPALDMDGESPPPIGDPPHFPQPANGVDIPVSEPTDDFFLVHSNSSPFLLAVGDSIGMRQLHFVGVDYKRGRKTCPDSISADLGGKGGFGMGRHRLFSWFLTQQKSALPDQVPGIPPFCDFVGSSSGNRDSGVHLIGLKGQSFGVSQACRKLMPAVVGECTSGRG